MVTTDRQSAFDRIICTVPGKGEVLNLLSAFWFRHTHDIIPNHMINTPHPNILLARQAHKTIPVEVVLRRYMARSSTSTSIYHNYMEKGRREIYGIDFPEDILPHQELPMGTILTPTTKAETGHDQELTDEQAQEIVDGKFGAGSWVRIQGAAYSVFERAYKHCLTRGLILADTKFEFGQDAEGNFMLIDELLTPDSSRFWLAATYDERLQKGENPESFDKEILRRWLAEEGFRGEGTVPIVPPEVIQKMSEAYVIPYTMITGKELPKSPISSSRKIVPTIHHIISALGRM